jgi:protease I
VLDTDYEAVVFVGGTGCAVFFDDPTAHEVARQALEGGSVVAACCNAPSILARAELLRGRRATSVASRRADLERHGAVWTGEPVTVDPPFVTANGPEAAYDFGRAIADLAAL